MTNHVIILDQEVRALLDDPAGPVGEFLRAVAEEVAMIARANAPVRVGNVWSERTTTARPPGFTKAGIHTAMGHHPTGSLWASANAPAEPTLFLEYAEGRMHMPHPFLTTALWLAPVP